MPHLYVAGIYQHCHIWAGQRFIAFATSGCGWVQRRPHIWVWLGGISIPMSGWRWSESASPHLDGAVMYPYRHIWVGAGMHRHCHIWTEPGFIVAPTSGWDQAASASLYLDGTGMHPYRHIWMETRCVSIATSGWCLFASSPSPHLDGARMCQHYHIWIGLGCIIIIPSSRWRQNVSAPPHLDGVRCVSAPTSGKGPGCIVVPISGWGWGASASSHLEMGRDASSPPHLDGPGVHRHPHIWVALGCVLELMGKQQENRLGGRCEMLFPIGDHGALTPSAPNPFISFIIPRCQLINESNLPSALRAWGEPSALIQPVIKAF